MKQELAIKVKFHWIYFFISIVSFLTVFFLEAPKKENIMFLISGIISIIIFVFIAIKPKVLISYTDQGIFIHKVFNKEIFILFSEITNVLQRNYHAKSVTYKSGKIIINTFDNRYVIHGVKKVDDVMTKINNLRLEYQKKLHTL